MLRLLVGTGTSSVIQLPLKLRAFRAFCPKASPSVERSVDLGIRAYKEFVRRMNIMSL